MEDFDFFKLPKEDRITYFRGHKAYYGKVNGKESIFYFDNNEDIDYNTRPCKFCNLRNMEYFINDKMESYDACLGKLPGVKFACCGHGAENGYILFKNGARVTLNKKQYGN